LRYRLLTREFFTQAANPFVVPKLGKKTIISVDLQVDKTRRILLDFEVDKLTNSIENIVIGDGFRTEVILVTKEDIKAITKKNG
jgi:hypothetical protein